MKIEIDPTYDALATESRPTNEEMILASGQRFVLPLTGHVENFIDSPTKEGEKGARFVLDGRWGFPPGFVITLDIEALVPEPCCDSAPCDCPTVVDVEIIEEVLPASHAPLMVEGDAPGAAPGTAPAAANI